MANNTTIHKNDIIPIHTDVVLIVDRSWSMRSMYGAPKLMVQNMIDEQIKNIDNFESYDTVLGTDFGGSLIADYIQCKYDNIINKGYIPMTYSEKDDLKIILKQMKRRGKIEQFKGNKKSKNYETLLLK